jgi:heterodisulfide reductase subunit C
MRMKISKASLESAILREVEDLSGESVWACYQCGNCSAGCPLSFAMEILPNQVIRLLNLGQTEEVFQANTVWLCASCLTCMTRCPRGVDLSRINEAIRYLALKRRKGPDRFGPDAAHPDDKEKAPPMALISAFRKLSR